VASVTLCDPRAPSTVKVAAVLLAAGGVLQFAVQVGGGQRFPAPSFNETWWPWPQLLSLAVTCGCAWLLARLNGIVYWFTIVMTGLGLGIVAVSALLTSLHVVEGWPISEAGVAAWVDLSVLFVMFALLVSKPSLRAPWATFGGFSQL